MKLFKEEGWENWMINRMAGGYFTVLYLLYIIFIIFIGDSVCGWLQQVRAQFPIPQPPSLASHPCTRTKPEKVG